jgi:catechol 2,3-dioxygenase-like lactoylglutathione lyase family enzyme
MSIDLDHTIVHARDRWAAAREVAGVLGVEEPAPYGPFAVVRLGNGVSLDFMEDPGEFTGQHYAFLVGEVEFDAVWGRLREQGRQFWADPSRHTAGQINRNDGGRGLYWEGPDGHWLEIITVPYGGGA